MEKLFIILFENNLEYCGPRSAAPEKFAAVGTRLLRLDQGLNLRRSPNLEC